MSIAAWRVIWGLNYLYVLEDEGPTRTLPVSVWAEIMTPAQSLTEVIHPTSLAGASSFSSGPFGLSAAWLLAGLFTFWASWKKNKAHLAWGKEKIQERVQFNGEDKNRLLAMGKIYFFNNRKPRIGIKTRTNPLWLLQKFLYRGDQGPLQILGWHAKSKALTEFQQLY